MSREYILVLTSDSVVFYWCGYIGQAAKKLPFGDVDNFLLALHRCICIVVQMNVSDFSGNLWLDAFNESAAVVLGMEAQKLGEMREKVSRRGTRQQK